METKVKKTIKDLPKVERPREKLMQYGPEKLSNSELLAILLRSGKKGENVIELANKILKKFLEMNFKKNFIVQKKERKKFQNELL